MWMRLVVMSDWQLYCLGSFSPLSWWQSQHQQFERVLSLNLPNPAARSVALSFKLRRSISPSSVSYACKALCGKQQYGFFPWPEKIPAKTEANLPCMKCFTDNITHQQCSVLKVFFWPLYGFIVSTAAEMTGNRVRGKGQQAGTWPRGHRSKDKASAYGSPLHQPSQRRLKLICVGRVLYLLHKLLQNQWEWCEKRVKCSLLPHCVSLVVCQTGI